MWVGEIQSVLGNLQRASHSTNRVWIPDSAILCCTKHLHPFWSSLNLLSVENRGTSPEGKRPRRAAVHVPSCSNDLRNG